MGSYRSAWRVKHKPMEAMAEREDARQLSGVVVTDGLASLAAAGAVVQYGARV
jgi:hypothetical protein